MVLPGNLRVRRYFNSANFHCVKIVQYGVFLGSYFPVFGLNTGKYGPEKTLYLNIICTLVTGDLGFGFGPFELQLWICDLVYQCVLSLPFCPIDYILMSCHI